MPVIRGIGIQALGRDLERIGKTHALIIKKSWLPTMPPSLSPEHPLSSCTFALTSASATGGYTPSPHIRTRADFGKGTWTTFFPRRLGATGAMM